MSKNLAKVQVMRRGSVVFALVMALVAVLPRVVAAAPVAVLGPADEIAVDQPRVSFGLLRPDNTLIGPTVYADGALDTGANGILLGANAYVDANGGKSTDYQPETDSHGTVYYDEQGVAGTSALTVYKPHYLEVQPTDPSNSFVLPNEVRAFGSKSLSLGFAGIVGMPAMMGKIIKVDMTPLNNIDYMGVSFDSSMPAVSGATSYSVPLTMLAPEFTGQRYPDDPTPTYAPLPQIHGVRLEAKSQSYGDQKMLLDTGAQLSMITQEMANHLGIDTSSGSADVIGTIPVSGVGGEADIPEVMLNSLDIPTTSGVLLRFTNVAVGVLDIPGLDSGVFGSNMLASGYYNGAFNGDPSGEMFNQFVLNFQNSASTGTGLLRLDLVSTPTIQDMPLPEPSGLALLGVCAVGLLVYRPRRRVTVAAVAA